MLPYELEIFNNILSSVAEEMGAVLIKAAYSPNIKERRDLSCALFDELGEMADATVMGRTGGGGGVM